MPSGEPCPRPDAKDTSCPLRPCCALARAEPLQLRSSSGCKRYILNALLMLRTSWCRRYTLKVTCRLNVRAHSSSSLPLQSAAYASASTRSLCAPQRAHNAVSFCPVCLSSGQRPTSRAPAARRAPCYRLVWRFGGRAPPQLQRVLALSPPRVGRLPSALLRTTCALRAQPLLSKFSFSSVLPPWRAREAIRPTRPQNEITCGRQLPHCRNRRNGSAQRSPVCCREQQTSPRWNSASLTAVCPDRGTAASSEHRGRQGIKLTTDSGSVWMQASTPRGKDAPCAADSATTCYETPAATWIETHDAARARGCWRSSHDGQPTVLYCVPTNPGPRSFHAWPVRRYCWRRS
jgi:hypothetical protein